MNLKDGQAVNLEHGTLLYKLTGRDETEVLAAEVNGEYIIYYRDGDVPISIFPPDNYVFTERIYFIKDQQQSTMTIISDEMDIREITDAVYIDEYYDIDPDADTIGCYFYMIIPDEDRKYQLPTLYYAEFDRENRIGVVDGMKVGEGFYGVFIKYGPD